MFKYSVRTAQKTHPVTVVQTSQLMLYREIIVVCSQIHTKHVNTLRGQNVELVNVILVVHRVTTTPSRVIYKELYIKTQSVPRSKHTPSQLHKSVS